MYCSAMKELRCAVHNTSSCSHYVPFGGEGGGIVSWTMHIKLPEPTHSLGKIRIKTRMMMVGNNDNYTSPNTKQLISRKKIIQMMLAKCFKWYSKMLLRNKKWKIVLNINSSMKNYRSKKVKKKKTKLKY